MSKNINHAALIFLKGLHFINKHFKFCVFLTSFFVISFGLFFFFPSQIVGDMILEKCNHVLQDQKIPLFIDSKSSHMASGFSMYFENVSIASYVEGSEKLHPLSLYKVQFRVNVLWLLLGRWNFVLNVTQADPKILKNPGYLKLSLFGNLWDYPHVEKMVSSAELTLNHFSIDQLLPYAAVAVVSNKTTWQMIAPILSQSQFTGELDGKIDYASSHLKIINLLLSKGNINFQQAALVLPSENIQNAQLGLKWDAGQWWLDKKSGWHSDHIALDIWGSIQNTQTKPEQLQWDLGLSLLILEPFQSTFGFLVPILLRCDEGRMQNGSLQAHLVGVSGNFVCR